MKPRQARFILAATSALLLAPTAFAVDTNGTWNTTVTPSSWSIDTNWTGNTIADGIGFTAIFNALDITAATTVNLDGARTIGNLTFGDTDTATAAAWILGTGTGGPLTLAGTTPTISVALGTNVSLTINALLAGTSGFTKSGSSGVILTNSGNNITGPVVISQGAIQLNAAALANISSLALIGGNLVIATTALNPIGGTISFGGGTLQCNAAPDTDFSAQFSTAVNQAYRFNLLSSAPATFGTNLSSPGGTLSKSGGGKLTLTVANTFDGATTLTGGNLALSHAQALQNSPINTTASTAGTASLGFILTEGVTAPVFGGLTGNKALKSLFDTDAEGLGLVGTGGYDGVTSLTLNAGIGASYSHSGIIVDGAVGMTLTKTGAGTQALSGVNSYTGGTAINGGILAIGNADALGTTGTISFGGGTLQYNFVTTDLSSRFSTAASQAYSVNTNGQSVTWASALTSSGGTLAKSGAGTLTLTGGLANTSSGAINVFEGTLSATGASLVNMTGAITVAAGGVLSFNQNFLAAPANNLTNALNLSGPGAGGTSGALNLFGNATASGPITLAADTTISHSFNNATVSGSITGTDRTLTLRTTSGSPQLPLLISGPISLGTGGITVQSASGTNFVTLSGNNSYTGETLVQTGTLKLTGSARINDSSTVRIDTGAVLDLDFTGTDTVGALYLPGDPNPKPNGTYGSLTSTATNKSADFLGAGILQVGAASDNYASWASSQMPAITGGENGDDDNDGVKNLVEYALINGGERGVLSGTTITFTKRGLPYGNDLTYIIETSETLSNPWSPAVTHGPAELGSPISYDLAPAPSTPKKFARLKVVKTP